MRKCPQCNEIKPIELFRARRAGSVTRYSWCRACTNRKSREYYKKDPDKRKRAVARYYVNNRERMCEINRRANYVTRIAVLTHYGGNPPECACCGERELKFLSIDHVDNDGAAQRKHAGVGGTFYRWLQKNNYPDGLQVLCHNCNLAKGFYGQCPHKLRQVSTASV